MNKHLILQAILKYSGYQLKCASIYLATARCTNLSRYA